MAWLTTQQTGSTEAFRSLQPANRQHYAHLSPDHRLIEEVTEDDLRQAFQAFGQVTSAKIIMDRVSGASRGFGFVEMPAEAEARAAITGLNGKELKERKLTVNVARPRSEGSGRGEQRSW